MNIFESLRADHDIQRNLCEALVKTSGNSDERKSLWKELRKELKAHSIAEERHFYIPLFDEDKTQKHARHGVAEHHEMDDLIKQLDENEMDSPSWLTYAKQLSDKVHHHLKDEEHTIFQLAGKVLSDSKKTKLANDYRKKMNEENAGIEHKSTK